ncbi:TIGR02450 family Trp-rich protein [Stutzerimonas balearica]|uniref:TIGR02450 family Trp-rich protein n=1 Tax=Stutzerimonas balearica TaxID=74829 RepID=UPI0028997103|nr:TIGR02450 family Trp-rich protein [Stutzerimonas balearica]
MNRFNPAKLRLSKWTARQPVRREKHFLVTDLEHDEAGTLQRVELQAVYSQRNEWIDWRELRDEQRWRIGWH